MPAGTVASIEHLRKSARLWWRTSPHWLVAAVLFLALLTALRWSFLRSPAPLGDEVVYLKAFHATLAGNSPYDVEGFFYPLAFARAGAWLVAALGDGGTLTVMRGANLLGLGLAFWVATAWLSMTVRARWLVAAAGLCLSPAVYAGLDLGNVSFFIVGLTLAALLTWPRRPRAAGIMLGLGVALKPIAVAAIPLLAVHRPRDQFARDGHRQLLSAAAAAVTAGILLLPISGLREMLRQEMLELAYARSFSLQRLLALFGVDLPQIALTATVIALAILGARRWPMSSVQLLCFTVAAISLATPLVWNHTLIVALPVQGLAVALAWHRYTANPREPSVLRRWEPILVALAVIMIHAGTTAGFDHLQPWLQVPFLLAVGLTPAALCAYVFRLTSDLEVPRAESPGSNSL